MSHSTARTHPASLVGFQTPIPRFAVKDLVVPDAMPSDEREWVPQGPNVWFRPLILNVTQGYFVNILPFILAKRHNSYRVILRPPFLPCSALSTILAQVRAFLCINKYRVITFFAAHIPVLI